MKTICPHCNQLFPEVPDEYNGINLQCSVCNQAFRCEEVKICPNCETECHYKASQCIHCGQLFASPASEEESEGDDGNYHDKLNIFTPWKNICVFSGRATRMEVFYYLLIVLPIFIMAGWFDMNLLNVVAVILLPVSLPLMVRRLHDMGNSALWLIALALLPILGLLLLIYPSKQVNNPYAYKVGRSKVGLIVSLVIEVVVIAVALCFLTAANSANAWKDQSDCYDKLREAAMSIEYYAQDNKGLCPQDLKQLIEKNYSTEDTWTCPSKDNKYIYLASGVNLNNIKDSNLPLIIENPKNHNTGFVILATPEGSTRYELKDETSCEGILKQKYPDIESTESGRIILANARKADGR